MEEELIEEFTQPETYNNPEKTFTDPITGKFVKGNPGGGRPKDSISLTTVIKRKLKALSPDGRREALEVLADNIIQDALDGGDIRKTVWNYIDGMPRQKVGIEGGEEGSAISINIVKYGDNPREVPAEGVSDSPTESV